MGLLRVPPSARKEELIMGIHTARAFVIGIVTHKPKLTYPKNGGHPTLSFVLEVSEPGNDGKTYKTYVPCEIYGKTAETVAEQLTVGEEVVIDGKLKNRSTSRNGIKIRTLVVWVWTVTRAAHHREEEDAISHFSERRHEHEVE